MCLAILVKNKKWISFNGKNVNEVVKEFHPFGRLSLHLSGIKREEDWS